MAKPLNKTQRIAFFKALQAANPNPTTELNYQSAFELLIAVILSAQATDKSVNIATQRLYRVANTPQGFLELGEETLRDYIASIGLYKTKAANIIKTCHRLVNDFNSEVPKTRQELESLPGVGRKTANVILNTLFGEPLIAVDTHVFRVSNRTGLASGKTPLDVETKLQKVVPVDFQVDAHHWLILLGRYICKARKPECWQCPVATICHYQDKTDITKPF